MSLTDLEEDTAAPALTWKAWRPREDGGEGRGQGETLLWAPEHVCTPRRPHSKQPGSFPSGVLVHLEWEEGRPAGFLQARVLLSPRRPSGQQLALS